MIYLTDVEGLLADVDDPTSLISRTTAGELQAMIDDGTLTGGMIPKVAAAHPRRRHGVGSAHILDGRVPHVLLLELFSDAGIGTMITARAGGWQRRLAPDAHLRPAPVTFVRGQGTELWDDDGKRYLDLLSGLAVTSLGHSPPRGGRALAEQARTLLHVSNLFGTEPARRSPPPSTGSSATASRPAARCSSPTRRRGQRVRHQAGPQVRRPRPPRRGDGLRQLPRPHASPPSTPPASRPSTRPFQPLPEGFRHVAWNDLDDLERALDPSVAAVLLEPVQGEGGVNPATPEYFQGVRGCATSGACCSWSTRCRPAWAHRPVVRLPARRRPCPTSSPWPRRWATACPSGPAGPRPRWPGLFEPGDHATTYGGQPLATAAARAVLATMEADDAPPGRAKPGARLTDALAAVPG